MSRRRILPGEFMLPDAFSDELMRVVLGPVTVWRHPRGLLLPRLAFITPPMAKKPRAPKKRRRA